MAVTIKDIARIANVSHTTVSRALHNHPAISPETMARIRKIADELGYVPNTVARGLKQGRSGVLGVIVRRMGDPFLAEVLDGIDEVLLAEGYSMFLAASKRDPEREKSIIRTMSEHRVDGVIICSTQVGEEHLVQLERFQVPCVLINNQASGETAALALYHDDQEGCRLLTHHLLGLGHVNIGYIGNNNGGRTNEDRLAGFRLAMAEAERPIREEWMMIAPNGEPHGGEMGADYFLSLPNCPTALICFNDMMAIGVMQTLQKAGHSVPDFCSVVGFDNVEMGAYVSPPLTTFHQPKFEMGQVAARLLLDLLRAKGEGAPKDEMQMLLGELRVRASTAAPRKF